jgi:Glycosyl hydrolases family 25
MVGRVVDISSNNHNAGPINWHAVAEDGVVAVFVKASQGLTYHNPYFAQDMHDARAAGILARAYHFAGMNDPIAEAEYFMAIAGADAVMLDYETNTNVPWAMTFLQRLGKPAAELITYGSASSLKDFYKQIPSLAFPAAYGQGSPGWGACWQFTNKASIAGITGPCDEDQWLSDTTSFETLFGVFDPPAEEEPVLIRYTPSGDGYWLISITTGAVYAYGDAQYFGGINNAGENGTSALVPGDTVTGFDSHPGAEGYIATTRLEHVYAFGASKDLGAP